MLKFVEICALFQEMLNQLFNVMLFFSFQDDLALPIKVVRGHLGITFLITFNF